MGFDDPIVWVAIAAIAIFLFGSSKIPGLARSLGQARREFDRAAKGEITPSTAQPQPESSDPLLEAAKREGINTQGKSKDQIAAELSWKLSKK